MKVNNWPTVLIKHIEAHRQTPFAWGTHDCMLWGASCVEAITGDDPAKSIRGTYDSALAAYRIIDSHGGFEETVEQWLPDASSNRIHSKMAQRGDLITTTDKRGRMALGVCDTHHGIFPGPDGLTFVKRGNLSSLAWRVK
jgi:hypothetical protein